MHGSSSSDPQQSPVRQGMASPSPAPDGTQGITVPLAPGHRHPTSTQDATTLSGTQDITA